MDLFWWLGVIIMTMLIVWGLMKLFAPASWDSKENQDWYKELNNESRELYED